MNFLIVSFFSLLVSVGHGQDCTYQFDQENSKIEGTGYKFTEKTGVTGQFPGFKLNQNAKKPSAKDLLTGLVVTVDLVTVETGNALRDKSLRETLFTGILGDSVATVKVLDVGEKKIQTEFKLNEKTQKVTFDYSIKKDTIKASGTIDLLKYAMGDQVAAFKKRCAPLHTGEDGKTVSWTDFKVSVEGRFTKTCK